MIEYEYIFGKHAVAEALAQRPHVVKQIFLDLNFSDAKIIKQVELAKVTVSPLNLKNPPRGVSANAAHQGIVAAINPDKLMVDYKNFYKNLEANPGTAVLILGEVQDPRSEERR